MEKVVGCHRERAAGKRYRQELIQPRRTTKVHEGNAPTRRGCGFAEVKFHSILYSFLLSALSAPAPYLAVEAGLRNTSATICDRRRERPLTRAPAGTSFATPLWGVTMAASPILQWPTTPTLSGQDYAICRFSVEPASPTCEHSSASSPTWESVADLYQVIDLNGRGECGFRPDAGANRCKNLPESPRRLQ